MARNPDAKGGASSFGGSPQFSPDVKVGPQGSFGPVSPKAPANLNRWGSDANPFKPILRYNPVQSPKQAAYVDARWSPAGQTPARGESVTIKGVNDDWRGKPAIARGAENAGASVRHNPVQSPKQAAYVAARWSPEGQKPARGKEVTIKGVTDAGWGRRAVGRVGGGMGGGGLMNRNNR
jgi:hypothetical protein